MALTLRTDSELEKALDALVAAEGGSRQEIIRKAVIDYYHRADLHAQVESIGERNLEKWADVFERLRHT
ncbi:CopG family transcriptional regulator [Intrasporangium chromatireducens Q5-1]|uniref:CopG family transcriptional regulator n=1 Tax=Intrasporangium chromatireducens Q5-1 TaxID=584657 RepID=W9GME6_9MICO|nr:ribbon-helix-helix protein, CopG family [Intrasporangium chromatireducens]EWT06287.1 CopG family transcriptional regulator [Intrasporangium chromatireducens Q5-1]